MHPAESGEFFDRTSQPLRIVAVIPARYNSTRLPGKALADIGGRPMIEHVHRRVTAARGVDRVIVATDDERIAAVVEGFGGAVQLTSGTHRSGTDRVAEVAASVPCDVVVNVQGDEPLIDPRMISEVVRPFERDPSLQMATLRSPVVDPADIANPAVVKVVTDLAGYALYFSRSPIPSRTGPSAAARVERHVGVYAYRRGCLLQLAMLAPTPLEQAESLEQLRALEHGIRILTLETRFESIGVDTPDDLERVRRLIRADVEDSAVGAGRASAVRIRGDSDRPT